MTVDERRSVSIRDFSVRPLFSPYKNQIEITCDQVISEGVSIREFFSDVQNFESPNPAFLDTWLTVVLDGINSVTARIGKPYSIQELSPGDLTLVPPGIPGYWRVSGRFHHMHIYLGRDLFSGIAEKALDSDDNKIELREQLQGSDRLIHSIGMALLDDLKTGGIASRLYRESLIHTLIVHLIHDHCVFPQNPIRVPGRLSRQELGRIVEYIQDSLSQDLSLAELASIVNLSPYHLVRLFKHTTGQTLHQYVIIQRVQAAQRLILEGKLPIAEIALRVGFADQSHLTRHFKELLGVSPGILTHDRKNLPRLSKILQDSALEIV